MHRRCALLRCAMRDEGKEERPRRGTHAALESRSSLEESAETVARTVRERRREAYEAKVGVEAMHVEHPRERGSIDPVVGQPHVDEQRIVEPHQCAVAAALRRVVVQRVEHELRPVQHSPVVEARPVRKLGRCGTAKRGDLVAIEAALHLGTALGGRRKAPKLLTPPLLDGPDLPPILALEPLFERFQRMQGAGHAECGLVGKLPP